MQTAQADANAAATETLGNARTVAICGTARAGIDSRLNQICLFDEKLYDRVRHLIVSIFLLTK